MCAKKYLHVPPWISPKSPSSHEIPILLVKSPFFIMKSPILVGQRSASKGSKRHLRHIVGLQLCEFRCLSSSTAAPGLNNLGFRRNDGNGELNGDWSTQIREFTGFIYILWFLLSTLTFLVYAACDVTTSCLVVTAWLAPMGYYQWMPVERWLRRAWWGLRVAPYFRTFLALDRSLVPLEKALLGALGRLLRLDPEVLRLVAASVINYTGSGAT